MVKKTSVVIYTDGSCDPNPGPGGWGAIVFIDGEETSLSGSETFTTNNRMEMLAAIRALQHLGETPHKILLYTDSKYLRNGAKDWTKLWSKNKWRKSDGKKVANTDLWKEIVRLNELHDIDWQWIPSHSRITNNQRADMLATQARMGAL